MSRVPLPSEQLVCPGDRLEHVLRSGRFAVTAELDAPDSADPSDLYKNARLLSEASMGSTLRTAQALTAT